jgi:hypothetical protein
MRRAVGQVAKVFWFFFFQKRTLSSREKFTLFTFMTARSAKRSSIYNVRRHAKREGQGTPSGFP